MLDPRERTLFVESLRPPQGYELDAAVGTTYSLDLAALLNVPLAITLYHHLSEEECEPDPLALLAALRRCADRVAVFCQAGQTYVPKSERTLFSYLEKSVVEVLPEKGVFHPKLWALRFTSPDEPVFYRVLVASRNLTFDRSWDTLLVLEGALTDRRNAYARNHPLADFVAALPGLALHRTPPRIRETIKVVSDELRRVDFELPRGIDEIRFWPLGISGHNRSPFPADTGRLLVVSPFASNETLKEVTEGIGETILVSRLETLSHLDPGTLDRFSRVFAMTDEAEPAIEAEEETADSGQERSLAPNVESDVPSGLHAKIYVADEGWKARLWTGSANATSPAFGGNVEFLVELYGGKYVCGVNHVLGENEESDGLAPFLSKFVPDAEPEPPTDEWRLAARLDEVKKQIASAKPMGKVSAMGKDDTYSLTLRASATKMRKAIADGIEATCRPIAVAEPHAAQVIRPNGTGSATIAEFPALSFGALTTFFAFSVKGRLGELERTVHFVLSVPIEGLPADREERLMLAILDSPDRVLRFLLMLLYADEEQISSGLGLAWEVDGRGNGAGLLDLPLFESLVRALQRDPTQIDSVARLVDDLSKTERGRRLLPPDFEKVWEPVRRARAAL